MAMNNRNPVHTKAAVSISEMARMVGLSRQRFAQLRGTTFPVPDYDPVTGRPFYGEEKQRVCLEVRRRNCGIDGRPVLFYARRSDFTGRTDRRRPTPEKPVPVVAGNRDEGLLDILKSVKLPGVDEAQVRAALAEAYPAGVSGLDHGEVVRVVLDRLRRKN